jgi:hypothetical protein
LDFTGWVQISRNHAGINPKNVTEW